VGGSRHREQEEWEEAGRKDKRSEKKHAERVGGTGGSR
jgi:hypothetical protein